MNKILKHIKVLVFFLIFSILFSFSLKVNAKEENDKDSESLLEYSEEYKQYLKLSDEEKAKLEVIPRKYNIPLDSLYEDFSLGSGGINDYSKDLPSKFDLRDKINIQVENQASYGLCWDFASMKSLETNLALRGNDFDFSELHVDYLESNIFGENRKLHEGGNFDNFKDYLEKEYGPVYESEVPYNAVYGEDDYDYLLNLEPKAYVYQTVDFPTIRRNSQTYTEEFELFKCKVKKHIMENGSLYCVILSPSFAQPYYNPLTRAEYFAGDWSQWNEGLHAVSIIGWDDNYSKENFNENQRPENDGAYIALNSWSSEWGDDGVFYISYEDYEVNTEISGIVSTGLEKECEEIIFKDRNLYNKIKEKLNLKKDFDDDKMTINVSKLLVESVTSLSLEDNAIVNLSGLEHFYNLNYLNLSNNNLENLEPIKKLENLESLYIDNCNITELPDLSLLNNLEDLSLSYNNINNLEEILKLENLIFLYLINCNITNCPDFSSLEMLCFLDLSENPIKTGKICANDVSLDNCDIDNDILNNLQFQNIQSLCLNQNKITDVSVLAKYNLESLELDNNPITDVSCLISIKYLYLSGTKNVKGIDKLTDLVDLEICNCELTDLNFLSNLKKLTSLRIENNHICDLSPLTNLPNLEYIYASNNNISQIPDELNYECLYLSNQNVTLNLNNNFEVGKETRIDLNEIFSYDRALEDFGGLIDIVSVNCGVNLNNKLIVIKPNKSGKSQASISVRNGLFAGSNFSINYSAKNKCVSIEPYIFDATYYADNNPDLKKAFGYNENQLKNHYYTWGIKEGRSASPVFDINYYMKNNPDIQRAFNNEKIRIFSHFINYGIYEGRQGSEEFDVKYYIEQYPDIAQTYVNDYAMSLIHYVCYGRKEGRYGSENVMYNKLMKNWINIIFDKDLYYSLYPDLQKAIGYNETALKEHYKNYGISEGRIGSYIVDQKYYINKYSDLKKVFGNNYRKAVIHFLTCGYKEGRCASQMFDINCYKSANSDVAKAYYNDNLKIINHFINFGINEGRLSSQEFNVYRYKNKNADLSSAYSNNWKKYYWHYLLFGKNEGRTCK